MRNRNYYMANDFFLQLNQTYLCKLRLAPNLLVSLSLPPHGYHITPTPPPTSRHRFMFTPLSCQEIESIFFHLLCKEFMNGNMGCREILKAEGWQTDRWKESGAGLGQRRQMAGQRSDQVRQLRGANKSQVSYREDDLLWKPRANHSTCGFTAGGPTELQFTDLWMSNDRNLWCKREIKSQKRQRRLKVRTCMTSSSYPFTTLNTQNCWLDLSVK